MQPCLINRRDKLAADERHYSASKNPLRVIQETSLCSCQAQGNPSWLKRSAYLSRGRKEGINQPGLVKQLVYQQMCMTLPPFCGPDLNNLKALAAKTLGKKDKVPTARVPWCKEVIM